MVACHRNMTFRSHLYGEEHHITYETFSRNWKKKTNLQRLLNKGRGECAVYWRGRYRGKGEGKKVIIARKAMVERKAKAGWRRAEWEKKDWVGIEDIYSRILGGDGFWRDSGWWWGWWKGVGLHKRVKEPRKWFMPLFNKGGKISKNAEDMNWHFMPRFYGWMTEPLSCQIFNQFLANYF